MSNTYVDDVNHEQIIKVRIQQGGITTVIHDDTLEGDGTAANPLSVVITNLLHHDETLTGDGTEENPLSVVGGGGGASSFAELEGSPYDNENLASALDAKQDLLSAGTGITIEENPQTGELVISADGITDVSAEDVSYTNDAVPSIENVQDALDNLMNIHYYVNPSYSSFSVSKSGEYDVGQVVEKPIDINWALNKTPISGDTQTLKLDGTLIYNIMSGDPSTWKSGSYTYNDQNFSSNTPKTYTFRADYIDNHSTVPSGKTNSCNASRTISFMYRRYWGTTTTETLSDAQLYALNNQLSTTRAQERDFNCSGGKYWWIVIPTTYCSGISFIDVASGLPMTLPPSCISTREITNSYGISYNVNVYRVEYKQTAASVKVKVQ